MPSAQPIIENGDKRMEINTHFGKQEVDPASVIHFPRRTGRLRTPA